MPMPTTEQRITAFYLFEAGLKTCPKCGETKSLSEFSNSTSNQDGYQSYCKSCTSAIYFVDREKRLEWQKEYGLKNRDKTIVRSREYYRKNKESFCASVKAYREKNIEKVLKYQKEYFASEHGKHVRSVNNHKRKSRVHSLESTLSGEQWTYALNYFEHKCAYCGDGDQKLHQEHFLCVSRGGGLTADNIIPACYRCNYNKRDMIAEEWIVGRGSSRVKPGCLDRIYEYFKIIQESGTLQNKRRKAYAKSAPRANSCLG